MGTVHQEWRVVGDVCAFGEPTGRTHESAPLHSVNSIQRAIARFSKPCWTHRSQEKEPFYRNVRVEVREITNWRHDDRWPTEAPVTQLATIPSTFVSAERAREWLLQLQRVGVGYRAVEESTGLSRGTICRIRSGHIVRILATAEARILAVDATCLRDHALVPGGPTSERIDLILSSGYSKRQLVAWLGCSSAWLYSPKKWVTARMESRVERLCRMLESGRIARAS